MAISRARLIEIRGEREHTESGGGKEKRETVS